MSLMLRSLFVLPVLVFMAGSVVSAAEVPTRYFDGAARDIVSSLRVGNGWCAVTARQQVPVAAGANADAVRYRIVTGYRAGMVNDQFFVEVTFGEETPWILVELGTPTQSGPSLTAAKAANEAVAKLDEALGLLEPAIAAEENADVRALGLQIVAVMRGQRGALVDLIQKDVAAVNLGQ